MVYGITMLFMINDDTIQGILAEVEVWIVVFILYLEIAQFSDYRQAFAKKAASLLALIFGCAVSFFCNILAFTILTPILCFLVPTVFEFVYLYLKLEQRSGKILNSNNDFVFEDDLYELNWNNRTAFLVKKGKQNNLIRSHIFCDNVWFDVNSFDDNCINNLSSLTIQNKRLPKTAANIESVSIDYNSHYCIVEEIIEEYSSVQNISITEKCKGLAINGNKLFSVKDMSLCFLARKSAHLIINESCAKINNFACQCCDNLEFVAVPSSVTNIGHRAFSQCKSLRSVTFSKDSQLKEIGIGAFSNTPLIKIKFPMSLERIQSSAFKPCSLLNKVVFPKGSSLIFCAFDAFDERNTLKIHMPYSTRLSFKRFQMCFDQT